MTDAFRFIKGDSPLLVSIPHAGTHIPDYIARDMTSDALEVPDTDFFLDKLYVFLRPMKIPHLIATHSRYVVDLNRPPDDKRLYRGTFGTGLFPELTFGGKAIYKKDKGVDKNEAESRMEKYYWPYHNKLEQELAKIKDRYGYAFLWDAHSIKSQVPSLFEGKLPDYNFGTNKGASCNIYIESKFRSLLYHLGDSKVVFDQRFIGGHIIRHYGDPKNKIHAIQLELSQKTYMDETDGTYAPEKAVVTMGLINQLIDTLKKTQVF